MFYPEFKLERWQSLRDQTAKINLSESGVEPLRLRHTELPENLEAGYGHTKGTPALREAIAQSYRGLEPEQILVTCGGAEANFVAINSLVGPGDRVCCMMPNYMQIPGLLAGRGANVSYFWLREEDFGFDQDAFDRALKDGTKLVALTSPNNPSGKVLTRDVLEYIVDRAKQKGAYVLCDEVYRGLEMAVATQPSIVELYEKGVATCSLSKVYGLPGLRIGWVAGNRDMVERAWAIKDYTTISPPIPSQWYALAALRSREKLLERARKIVAQNMELVTGLPDLQKYFRLRKIEACPFLFVKTSFTRNTWSYCEWIYRERGVLINPGEAFELPGYVRIWIGHSDTNWMKDALRSLVEATSAYLASQKAAP